MGQQPVPARNYASRALQVSVTTFSQTGVARRGDGREWTETPAQKLMRLTAAATAEPAALPPAAGPGADVVKAAATARTVDAYNAGARRKTLVEQHQDRLAAEQKVRPKPSLHAKFCHACYRTPESEHEDLITNLTLTWPSCTSPSQPCRVERARDDPRQPPCPHPLPANLLHR